MNDPKMSVIEGARIPLVLLRLLTRPFLVLLLIPAFAALMPGNVSAEPRRLLIASIGSAICLLAYASLAFVRHDRRNWLLAVVALAGFVPYLFGLYVLCRGLWTLTELGQASTLSVLARMISFVVAGYSVVRDTWVVTEFTRAAANGGVEPPEETQRSREVLTLVAGVADPEAMARLEREIPGLDADSSCWCGSGSPFRACHHGRDQEARLGLEDLRQSVERTMRRHRRGCLHPMAGLECSGTGTFAHSVQRAELQKIAVHGHVLAFTPTLPERLRHGRFEPRRIGINNASTFTGFCNRHDTQLFAPLETAPFVGSDEQLFLLAYRALCLELFAKEWALARLIPTMRLLDRGEPVSVQVRLQAAIALDEIGKREALALMSMYKGDFDEVVQRGDRGQLRYLACSLPDAPALACTGALVPAGNFAGRPRAGLRELTDLVPPVFAITPTTTGGVAMLAWLGESPANSDLAASLDALPDQQVPSALLRYAFTYCENLFMSPAWWNALDPSLHEFLIQRMNAKAADGSLADDGRELASWKIGSRLRRF